MRVDAAESKAKSDQVTMAHSSKQKSATVRRAPQGAVSIDWLTVPLLVGKCGKTCTPPGVLRRAAFQVYASPTPKGGRFESEAKDLWKLPDQDLWIFCEGHADMRLGEKHFKAAPGTCLWLRPGIESKLDWTVTSKCDLVTIWVHFDTLSKPGGRPFMPKSSQLPPPLVEVTDIDFFVALAARLVNLLNPPIPYMTLAEENSARNMAQVILRIMLLEYWQSVESVASDAGTALRHRRAVSEVAAEIHRDPGGCKDIGRLASRRGYHSKYFARLFREFTGQNPREFLIQAKIHKAQDLLRNSDLSVGEVADLCGYSSVYFLSRQFKQSTGLTPTEYRAAR